MFAETQYSIGLGNSGMGSHYSIGGNTPPGAMALANSLGHGSCCDSCAKGGPCGGGKSGLGGCCGLMGASTGLGSCCDSCAKGGPCGGLGGFTSLQSPAKAILGVAVLAAVFFGGRHLMFKLYEPESQRYAEGYGSGYSPIGG